MPVGSRTGMASSPLGTVYWSVSVTASGGAPERVSVTVAPSIATAVTLGAVPVLAVTV